MKVLAINPWIYDFAAYDFWLKPYGFLAMLTYLKQRGVSVEFIDCLDKKVTTDAFGRGKYTSEIISKPPLFEQVRRYYKRYGISPQEFRDKISRPQADFILVSSSMTYWYPAIFDLIGILKEVLPPAPIILGGTYATLCFEHAKKTIPADYIFRTKEIDRFCKLLNIEYNPEALYSTLPAYEDFYDQSDYVVFRTSWGCTFSCSYCAIGELFPGFFRVPQEKVLEFIFKYAERGIKDFVFYDEALFYESTYIKSLLKKIINAKLGIRFHTPNALHLKFLDQELALFLRQSGFINPHFGLETVNPELQKSWGDKVNMEDLLKGIDFLLRAGFKKGEFSVYLILGYPGQKMEELKQEMEFLHSKGVRISLAEFSLTPCTKLYNDFCRGKTDPLFQNNSVFSFSEYSLEDMYAIKNHARKLNGSF